MTELRDELGRIGWRTADGMPISPEPPYGAAVVVSRAAPGGPEFLLLHRAHHGVDFEGEWAWGPPAGARLPGEALLDCARRELLEETGLGLEPVPSACGTSEWAVFTALAPADAGVRLSPEHDRHVWLPADEAAARCHPAAAGDALRAAARA